MVDQVSSLRSGLCKAFSDSRVDSQFIATDDDLVSNSHLFFFCASNVAGRW